MKDKLQKSLKILKISFLVIFCLQITAIFILIAIPLNASAADPIPLEFKPQIQIPGLDYELASYDSKSGKMSSDLLARYIQALYSYGLGIAGIIAAIVLMAAGVLWITSAGDSGKIGQAKELIFGTLIGIVILFSSWIILNTVNPELLNFKAIYTLSIPKMTFCCDPVNGNIATDKQGECPSSSPLCSAGTECTNKGDNSFACIDKTKFWCCEYTNTTAGLKYCVSVPLGGSCSPSASYQPYGYTGAITFNYVIAYTSTFCPIHVRPIGVTQSQKSDCNEPINDCTNTDDGDQCEGNSSGWCYNQICWTGDGKEGEPCGDTTDGGGSVCFQETPNSSYGCPLNYDRE